MEKEKIQSRDEESLTLEDAFGRLDQMWRRLKAVRFLLRIPSGFIRRV